MTENTPPDIAARLKDLGITLPRAASPLASYVPVVRTGNLLFISGQLSANEDGLITGTLGRDITLDVARTGARNAALSILAHIEQTAGVPLDRVSRFVKLSIFVASAPDFHEHHLVANGASDIIAEIFGDRGKHARAAFGVAALPLGAAVEIEAVVEIAP